MNDDELRQLLKSAVPPVADTELKHDLWPHMLRRLDERAVRVPWPDWALVALLAIWLFAFPAAVPGLLYHL
jgi:hypothetical protein